MCTGNWFDLYNTHLHVLTICPSISGTMYLGNALENTDNTKHPYPSEKNRFC